MIFRAKLKIITQELEKYSTLVELENALVNDDNYATGENKYNIPQLKKYVEDNFYSRNTGE